MRSSGAGRPEHLPCSMSESVLGDGVVSLLRFYFQKLINRPPVILKGE